MDDIFLLTLFSMQLKVGGLNKQLASSHLTSASNLQEHHLPALSDLGIEATTATDKLAQKIHAMWQNIAVLYYKSVCSLHLWVINCRHTWLVGKSLSTEWQTAWLTKKARWKQQFTPVTHPICVQLFMHAQLHIAQPCCSFKATFPFHQYCNDIHGWKIVFLPHCI